MREEHRHIRDEGWGPSRPGRPEWGPGRGPGRGRGAERDRGDRGDRGGERDRGGRGERGGPGWGGRGGWGWNGPGPFPFMDPAMGMRGFGRHGSGGGHRSRARRGDVRAAILDLLAEDQSWDC